MIAPGSRLLWLTAFTIVPCCAVFYFAPAFAAVGLVAMLALFAWDAAQAVLLLRTIGIIFPERASWYQDRASSLEFQITNAARRSQEVRVFLELPGFEGQTYPIPAEAMAFDAVATSTPPERGRFAITEVQLEALSPLKLWHARAPRATNLELRVYPDLRQDMASLLLARQSNGAQRQRQMGKGREFEKLRDYVPGDRYDEIHWRASARHGKPVVKVTQIERTQQVYVVLDGSRLSGRPGVLDRFVHAALGIAIAAETQGDRFGLVLFSDQVDGFVRAGSGKAHFSTCREAIYGIQPRRVSPDFEELFSFVQLRIRTRSLLLFLTALDDPLLAEMFVKSVPMAARRHLVMVSVPQLSGARPLFTGEEPASLDQVYTGLAGHMQWTQLRELAATLQHAGVKLTSVAPERATAEVARQYFDVRRRQLL